MKLFRTIFAIGLAAILIMAVMPAVQAASTYIPGAHTVAVQKFDDITTNNPAIGALAEARRIALAPSDYSGDGKPKRFGWYTPQVKIPGVEATGYFDDAKFVIRIPEKWNGKLVVMGAPGVGDERSADATISDYAVTKTDAEGNSYAYACIDKGTTGEAIPTPDGKLLPWAKAMTALISEQDTIEEWNVRLHQITVAAKDLLQRTRGQVPVRTYLVGLSNGGYAARYAIEKDAALYDGMLDWEGVLWRANEQNIISSLTEAVNSWQVISNPVATTEEKNQAYATFTNFGVSEQARFILPYHAAFYYLPTLNQLRVKLDPEYKAMNWWEYLGGAQDYKDYNYFSREKAKVRVAKFQNTGDIKKPVITVHGTWDTLLFPNVHAKGYEALVKKAGKSESYRLYMIDHGNHFEGLVGNPAIDKNKQLQPLLPYVHQAFDILVDWVEHGIAAPSSQTIPMPQSPENAIDIRSGGEISKY